MTSLEDDAMAFRDLFERHHVEIRRYLRHRVADANVAEDLAAETFARAFAARNAVDAPRPRRRRPALRTYAYTPSSHALSAASRAAASTPSANRCALIPTTPP
jgi:DNA-directed RNA polymerase specialized sigma24 family protein